MNVLYKKDSQEKKITGDKASCSLFIYDPQTNNTPPVREFSNFNRFDQDQPGNINSKEDERDETKKAWRVGKKIGRSVVEDGVEVQALAEEF